MEFLLNLTLLVLFIFFIKKLYFYSKTHSLKGIESVLKPSTTPNPPKEECFLRGYR